jgi:ketosteroid isomerase-like protein
MDALERLLAEKDIRDLIGTYAQLDDDGDAEALSLLFAADGAVHVAGRIIDGRSQIRDWVSGVVATRELRHLMTNERLTVESEDVASGSVDMTLLEREAGVWRVASTHRYRDRYVKQGGAWRFARREITIW